MSSGLFLIRPLGHRPSPGHSAALLTCSSLPLGHCHCALPGGVCMRRRLQPSAWQQRWRPACTRSTSCYLPAQAPLQRPSAKAWESRLSGANFSGKATAWLLVMGVALTAWICKGVYSWHTRGAANAQSVPAAWQLLMTSPAPSTPHALPCSFSGWCRTILRSPTTLAPCLPRRRSGRWWASWLATPSASCCWTRCRSQVKLDSCLQSTPADFHAACPAKEPALHLPAAQPVMEWQSVQQLIR